MYQFYVYVHDVLNIHVWDIPALITAVLVITVWAVHRHNQKKREEEFNEMMEEKVQMIWRPEEGSRTVND